MLQLTDEAFAIIKKIWSIGHDKSGYWYLGRTTHDLYDYKSMEGEPQPDTVYVVSYVDHDKEYEEFKNTLEEAAARCAQLTGATIEEADWAGGSDKQPYVFDWTKQRVSDLLTAMDMEDFMSGINPLSSLMNGLTEMSKGISKLAEGMGQISSFIEENGSNISNIGNLESRIAALEAIAGISNEDPGNGGDENNGGLDL